jgi:hypothetical protein
MRQMIDAQFWNIEKAAGLILVFSNLFQFPGLIMFWERGGVKGGLPHSRAHFILERSFIMGSAILTAIGFVVLAEALQNRSGFVLGLMGSAGFLIGAVLIVAAEALSLTIGFEKLYPIVNIYVILAFLSQAVIGGSMLQSGLTAAWAGWAGIGWNMGWLVAIPLLSPRDIYFPILHSVMPLLMGIALLIR